MYISFHFFFKYVLFLLNKLKKIAGKKCSKFYTNVFLEFFSENVKTLLWRRETNRQKYLAVFQIFLKWFNLSLTKIPPPFPKRPVLQAVIFINFSGFSERHVKISFLPYYIRFKVGPTIII